MEDILFNGLNFIENAVDTFLDKKSPTENRLKYSVIHFYIGLELLLKSRLAHEHYTLIIRDLKKYQKGDYEKGDFVSVGYDESIDRLKKICGLQVDQRAKDAFKKIQQTRNKFIHFHCNENEYQITAQLLETWHHLLRLIENKTLSNIADDAISRVDKIKFRMLGLQEFVDERFKLVQDDISRKRNQGITIITCPYCYRKSMYLEEGVAGCLVCGTDSLYSDKVAEDWSHHFNEAIRYDQGDELILGQCINCEADAVVLNCNDDIETVSSYWFCFSCLQEYDKEDQSVCSNCNKTIVGFKEAHYICPECNVLNSFKEFEE